MAQDRINFLCQRLEEGAAIAAVIRAARTLVNNPPALTYVQDVERLHDLTEAVTDLWDAAYIELPDDSS